MKKFVAAIIILVIIIGGVYLGFKFKTGKNNLNLNPNQNKSGALVRQTVQKEKEVTLYYANKEYALTGDESLEKVLPLKKKIKYEHESLYTEIIKELAKSPQTEGLETDIPNMVKVLGVEVKDGIANINFSSEGLIGSSLQETLMINQIVNTFTDLEGVNAVQFLVDGKKSETLMGHADITEPFYKTVVLNPSEMSLGGMKLNIKRKEFVDSFGQPNKSTFSKNKREEYLEYAGFKVVIANGKTLEISTTSDKYATPSGVKVGDSKENVIKSFGEPTLDVASTEENVEKLTYQVNNEGFIKITISNGKVSEIAIRLQV